jgi:hypothetical protein
MVELLMEFRYDLSRVDWAGKKENLSNIIVSWQHGRLDDEKDG